MPWLTASDYKLPDKSASTGDFILAYDVRSDLMNADDNFIKVISPQYASPEAYIEAMIVWAQSIVHFTPYLLQSGWNPIQAAILASFSCFDMLRHMAVNPNDPNTQNIYDAWTKVPTLPATIAVPGDGTNASTGASQVQYGSILGGTKK